MKQLYTAILLFIAICCRAQDNQWATFINNNDDGFSTVQVNMGLMNSAKFNDLPYLIICGPYCKTPSEGIPNTAELRKLDAMLAATNTTIASGTKYLLAGSVTDNKKKTSYYYVKDTAGLQKNIQKLYKSKGYQLAYSVQQDNGGSVYASSLYPTQTQRDWIFDMNIITKLKEMGDKLDKPHRVIHRIYFKNDEIRRSFITYAQKNQYTIGKQDKFPGNAYPYTLEIAHTTMVTPEAITPITQELRDQAEEFDGRYDGWQTNVISNKKKQPVVAKK